MLRNWTTATTSGPNNFSNAPLFRPIGRMRTRMWSWLCRRRSPHTTVVAVLVSHLAAFGSRGRWLAWSLKVYWRSLTGS